MSVFQKAFEAECEKNKNLESENRRLREALEKVMSGRSCWSKCYTYGCMCGFKEAKEALHPKGEK